MKNNLPETKQTPNPNLHLLEIGMVKKSQKVPKRRLK
jgi:hypothetical protein